MGIKKQEERRKESLKDQLKLSEVDCELLAVRNLMHREQVLRQK